MVDPATTKGMTMPTDTEDRLVPVSELVTKREAAALCTSAEHPEGLGEKAWDSFLREADAPRLSPSGEVVWEPKRPKPVHPDNFHKLWVASDVREYWAALTAWRSWPKLRQDESGSWVL